MPPVTYVHATVVDQTIPDISCQLVQSSEAFVSSILDIQK